MADNNSMQFNVEMCQASCYQQTKLNVILIKYTGQGGIAIPSLPCAYYYVGNEIETVDGMES